MTTKQLILLTLGVTVGAVVAYLFWPEEPQLSVYTLRNDGHRRVALREA